MRKLNYLGISLLIIFGLVFNYVGESEAFNHSFSFSEGEMMALTLGMDLDYYRSLRDAFIRHETGGTFDPKQKQIGGGPGRGLFQMDPHTLVTNTKRLFTYHLSNKLEIPGYLDQILYRKITDATQLSRREQEVLFIGGLIIIVYDGHEYKTVLHPSIRDGEAKNIPNVWISLHNRSTGIDALDRFNDFTKSI